MMGSYASDVDWEHKQKVSMIGVEGTEKTRECQGHSVLIGGKKWMGRGGEDFEEAQRPVVVFAPEDR
jgi:hypothetical protein